jgi:hypothetical protein
MNIGVVVGVLVATIFGFAAIFGVVLLYKRSYNLNKVESAQYCIFYGHGKVMDRLLPIKDGLVVAPEGRFKKKSEKHKVIDWPKEGYLAVRNAPVTMWPWGAIKFLQAPVGVAFYAVGNPTPLKLDLDYPAISSDTVKAIRNSQTAVKLFNAAEKGIGGGGEAKLPKNFILLMYVCVGACAIVAIMMVYLISKFGGMSSAIDAMRAGSGL